MTKTGERVVFIVEDSEMYAMMLDYKLKKLINYSSQRFTSGEECVKNLSLSPSVIILDYILPKMNGLETLKRIKEYNKNIPVIVLSSQQEIGVAVSMLKEGAYDYVIKDDDTVLKLERIIRKIFSIKTSPVREEIAL